MPKKTKEINETEINETIEQVTVSEVPEELYDNPESYPMVTIRVKPRFNTEGEPTLELPVTLIEPFLNKTVELLPTAQVTYSFAKQLTENYDYYEIIGDDEITDMTQYKVRPDYKADEVVSMLSALSLQNRFKVIEFIKSLNASDNGGKNK